MVKKFFVLIIALVAAILSFRWLTKSREDTDWVDTARPGKVIAVDGIALHYVESGDPSRPHIVMIHGFGGHTFSFRYQLAEFSRDHHVIAIDLKGFGYSERSERGDYSLTEQSRLVLRAMDILKIDRATLVGHSMGGEVVMRVAAAAPERVERLVLAASVSGQRVPFAPRLPFIRPFLPGLSRLVMVRNFGKKMFYDPSTVDVEGIRATYLDAARVRGSMNTIWEMWGDVPGDQPIAYSSITQPVLVLAAEKERVIPFYSRVVSHLRANLPQAEVQTIERTGHLLLEENPERANAAIRAFIGTTEGHAEPVPAVTA
jgi:pimeloyl-ACP methyl ester carboxylesterase